MCNHLNERENHRNPVVLRDEHVEGQLLLTHFAFRKNLADVGAEGDHPADEGHLNQIEHFLNLNLS